MYDGFEASAPEGSDIQRIEYLIYAILGSILATVYGIFTMYFPIIMSKNGKCDFNIMMLSDDNSITYKTAQNKLQKINPTMSNLKNQLPIQKILANDDVSCYEVVTYQPKKKCVFFLFCLTVFFTRFYFFCPFMLHCLYKKKVMTTLSVLFFGFVVVFVFFVF